MSDETPNYRWSWLLLLLFFFGAVLAVLWVIAEGESTQRIRDLNNPPPVVVSTNK
jgi:hypothetical protein